MIFFSHKIEAYLVRDDAKLRKKSHHPRNVWLKRKPKGIWGIDLDTVKHADAREVCAEWPCWQTIDRLGIGDFLRHVPRFFTMEQPVGLPCRKETIRRESPMWKRK